MRKHIIKFFALILTFAALVSMASCTLFKEQAPEPNFDLYAAYENLETENYYRVKYYSSENDSDKEFLKSKSLYAVKSFVAAVKDKDVYEDIGELSGIGDDDIFSYDFMAAKFENEEQAQVYYDYISDYYETLLNISKKWIEVEEKRLENFSDMKVNSKPVVDKEQSEETIKEAERDIEKLEEISIGISGRVVWLGKKDAINDTKD